MGGSGYKASGSLVSCAKKCWLSSRSVLCFSRILRPHKIERAAGLLQVMFALGIIFVLVGVFLAGFNLRVAKKVHGRGYYAEEFLYSVSRQNVAVIGAAFVFGGFLMIYLD